MDMITIYYMSIGTVFIIAILIFIQTSKIKPKFNYRFSKRNRYNNDIFKDLNVNITLKQYVRVRNIFILILLLAVLFELIIYREFFYLNHILVLVILTIITSPKEKIFNFPLPLYGILKYFSLKKMKSMDVELTRAISQIKNIVNSRKENVSSNLVLIEIRRFTIITRSIFNRVICFWDMGEKKKACNYLKDNIKTDKAKIIADILIRFDDIDKEQMLNEIDFYQEKILNERETQIIKSRENRSFVVYALATLSIMVVLINFIIIVSYFDTINMLKSIM